MAPVSDNAEAALAEGGERSRFGVTLDELETLSWRDAAAKIEAFQAQSGGFGSFLMLAQNAARNQLSNVSVRTTNVFDELRRGLSAARDDKKRADAERFLAASE